MRWSEQDEVRRILRQLPDSMNYRIVKYVEDHVEPGEFLMAVFSNDLYLAAKRADYTNKTLLALYGDLLEVTPVQCWGSWEQTEEWLYGESFEPTPYAIRCPKHGVVFLTHKEYQRQLDRPDSLWECPRMDHDPNELGLCGRISCFCDGIYEEAMGI